MKSYMLLPLWCVILIGCNKPKTDVPPDAGIDESHHTTAVGASILGNWQSGEYSGDLGTMTYTLKFTSDGLCSILMFVTDVPDKPFASIDGSWKFDGSSGLINWNKSAFLSVSDESIVTQKNIENEEPDSFQISGDSILQINFKDGVVVFKKSPDNI